MSNLNIFDKSGYHKWRYPSCWHKNVRVFFGKLKHAKQRVTNGVAESDCWDLDYYLLNIIHDSLVIFKRDNNSYPYEVTEEEWGNILDTMIQLAEKAITREREDNPYADEYHSYLMNHNINSDRTEEEEQLIKKFYDAERQFEKERHEARAELFKMLDRWMDALWW